MGNNESSPKTPIKLLIEVAAPISGGITRWNRFANLDAAAYMSICPNRIAGWYGVWLAWYDRHDRLRRFSRAGSNRTANKVVNRSTRGGAFLMEAELAPAQLRKEFAMRETG